VRGRLWRCSNPALDDNVRQQLVETLMQARRAVGLALRVEDAAALSAARAEIDVAKVKLGERGLPWWTDGAPDYNQHMVHNSPYAEWFAGLDADVNG
jgi:hypothetical protein